MPEEDDGSSKEVVIVHFEKLQVITLFLTVNRAERFAVQEKCMIFDAGYMKRSLLSGLMMLAGLISLHAQPCVRIESLLVDACGTPEGENEMLRFRTGNQALNVADLTVNWSGNAWLGICQSPQTAAVVNQINAGITQCGHVLEPPQGVIPPNAQVILITSENFNPASNPFTQLSDTVYVLFQCAGNVQGHLANATSTGIRTVSISFAGVPGCTQSVTYDCGQLTDIYGNTGTVGNTPSERDGASVMYPPTAAPVYYNYGCQAPVVPAFVDAGPDQNACPGDTIWLQGSASSVFNQFQWSGGNGVFLQNNQLQTGYVVSAQDYPVVNLTLTGYKCNGSLVDALQINVNQAPNVQIFPAGLVGICNGGPVKLQATASDPVLWSNGSTGNSYLANQPGWVVARTTNACGTAADSVQLADGLPPDVSIGPTTTGPYCMGGSATLSAVSGSQVNWLWDNGATISQITVNQSGTYMVTGSNACGSTSKSFSIQFTDQPQLNVLTAPNPVICTGQSVTLEAQGNGIIQWNGQHINPLNVSVGGVYTVMCTNPCGMVSQQIVVTESPYPDIQFNGNFPLGICPGQFLQLEVTANAPVTWNSGTHGQVENVYEPGRYIAVAENICGRDSVILDVTQSSAKVTLEANPLVGVSPITVTFTPDWIGTDSVSWDVPGILPDLPGPVEVLYDTMATLVYTITGVDQFGCKAYASVELHIAPDRNFGFFVPNSFTPNGDGINDIFRGYGFGITGVKGQIFDRWGEIIYEISGIQHGWDGKLGPDEEAPIGTYVYRFEVKNKANEIFIYVGKVNLIR